MGQFVILQNLTDRSSKKKTSSSLYTSSPTPPSRPDFSASIGAFVSMSAPRHDRSERAEVFAAQ